MTQGVHTTIGLFPKVEDAAAAIDDLVSRGYTIDQISAVAYESDQIKELKTRTQTDAAEIGEGAVKGAGAGAIMGGLAGLLLAAVPGAGPFLAAGPIAAALGGAATGAALGGAIGALTHIGMSEEQARAYEERLKSGDMLIAVSTTNENDIIAENILRNHDGENVHTLHNVDVSETRERTGAPA